MKKSKTLGIVLFVIVIVAIIIMDFVLNGIFRDYPLIFGFLIWIIIYIKFKVDYRVYLGLAIFLLMSEFFFAVYKMEWFLHRVAAWVYFILLFVLITQTVEMLRENK